MIAITGEVGMVIIVLGSILVGMTTYCILRKAQNVGGR